MGQRIVQGAPRPRIFGAQDVCEHAQREPVALLEGGDVVAQLCTICDKQLEADYDPRQHRRP